MDRDGVLIPPSPTASSVSSSDLDTESNSSFFPDRSTTLGTLMGVTLPVAPPPTGAVVVQTKLEVRDRRPRRRPGRSWWRLCRDDIRVPTSLGDFLQMERMGGDEIGRFLCGEHEAVGGGALFEDGRVLPPTAAAPRQAAAGRLPVLLGGICSGG